MEFKKRNFFLPFSETGYLANIKYELIAEIGTQMFPGVRLRVMQIAENEYFTYKSSSKLMDNFFSCKNHSPERWPVENSRPLEGAIVRFVSLVNVGSSNLDMAANTNVPLLSE